MQNITTRQFGQMINKRKIIKFLEVNLEKRVNCRDANNCPIAEYLLSLNLELASVTPFEIEFWIGYKNYYFKTSRWVKKFIKMVDKFPETHNIVSHRIKFSDILEEAKKL